MADCLDDFLADLECDSELLKNIKMDKNCLAVAEGSTVHFLVTDRKAENFSKHCNQVVLASTPEATINTYTDNTNGMYREINLALAADSGPGLQQHGAFIQQLRASILSKPLLEPGPFFRGVQLSQKEIDHMEFMKHFFIPSFTSTSVNSAMAYDKNATLCISTSYCSKYACSVTADLSKFYSTEKEVLLPCYTAYTLQRTEFVNKKHLLSLHIDEYSSSLDALVPFTWTQPSGKIGAPKPFQNSLEDLGDISPTYFDPNDDLAALMDELSGY